MKYVIEMSSDIYGDIFRCSEVNTGDWQRAWRFHKSTFIFLKKGSLTVF